MKLSRSTTPYKSPDGNQYDAAMANTERMSVERARKVLGNRLELAKKDELHTIITKHGENLAVLVPMEWYRRARELLGDPTDL